MPDSSFHFGGLVSEFVHAAIGGPTILPQGQDVSSFVHTFIPGNPVEPQGLLVSEFVHAAQVGLPIHPELHCFRRSIPRMYAPLSTLRVLPRGSIPRMTRGQCGSLLLYCDGLSPSTSCRSSRRTAAQWLAYTLPYRRFADALADACAQIGGEWIATPS